MATATVYIPHADSFAKVVIQFRAETCVTLRGNQFATCAQDNLDHINTVLHKHQVVTIEPRCDAEPCHQFAVILNNGDSLRRFVEELASDPLIELVRIIPGPIGVPGR